ncbi:MAG: DUF1178 family protein [Alphaproteobacteria bacterium]|nr:MAG: DUF1178 family protein [Alphaproteobacteria bacterium]
MIVFDLRCTQGHTFEAWFKSSTAYEEQRAAGAIICPMCGDVQITKAPMAPNIATGKSDRAETGAARAVATRDRGTTTHMLEPQRELFHHVMEKLRHHVEKNFDYVGRDFPEEARKIHYGEVEARPIYGEATPHESRELREEGVDVIALPFPAKRDS